MSVQTAIAAIYNLLKTVDGVGPNIYSMIRFSNEDATFNNLFVDATTDPSAPVVHTWMVSREATPAADDSLQATSQTHSIVMTGFLGFKDGVTEPLWQAEIEAVCDAFRPLAARRFDNTFDWSGPPMVEGVKLVMFRNVLCHTARIIHPVREYPLS
jgi:hypothetical protein